VTMAKLQNYKLTNLFPGTVALSSTLVKNVKRMMVL